MRFRLFRSQSASARHLDDSLFEFVEDGLIIFVQFFCDHFSLILTKTRKVLHLEKRVHTWWPCAINGHPCIDTQRVDSSRHIRCMTSPLQTRACITTHAAVSLSVHTMKKLKSVASSLPLQLKHNIRNIFSIIHSPSLPLVYLVTGCHTQGHGRPAGAC